MKITQTQQSFAASNLKRAGTALLAAVVVGLLPLFMDGQGGPGELWAGASLAALPALLAVYFFIRSRGRLSPGATFTLELREKDLVLSKGTWIKKRVFLQDIKSAAIRGPYLMVKTGMLTEVQILADVFEDADIDKLIAELAARIDQKN